MDSGIWRIIVLVALIAAAWYLFRPRRRGGPVCARCGFAAHPGTPACPRCGQDLDMSTVDLGRLEEQRRRGEIDEDEYRRRKLALIRGDDSGGRDEE